MLPADRGFTGELQQQTSHCKQTIHEQNDWSPVIFPKTYVRSCFLEHLSLKLKFETACRAW